MVRSPEQDGVGLAREFHNGDFVAGLPSEVKPRSAKAFGSPVVELDQKPIVSFPREHRSHALPIHRGSGSVALDCAKERKLRRAPPGQIRNERDDFPRARGIGACPVRRVWTWTVERLIRTTPPPQPPIAASLIQPVLDRSGQRSSIFVDRTWSRVCAAASRDKQKWPRANGEEHAPASPRPGLAPNGNP